MRPTTTPARPLHATLSAALEQGADGFAPLAAATPLDDRDRYASLLAVYALHTAPLERLGARARFQHHPAVAAVKQRLEAAWLAELESTPLPAGVDPSQPVEAMRTLAARDRLPSVYKWLARSATWHEVVEFLALEGGPDAGFDDLVAVCQLGLEGPAKLELAANYWDEMGNGEQSAVHTNLHHRLVTAVGMPTVPLDAQPVSALARAAFGGLLATNRWLQPEMLGALGLIELQAGPRSRLVLQALHRCGAPGGAYPFYEVHADVDPRHGTDWLDNAIVPTIAAHPHWGARIVRGAHWRALVNAAFLADVEAALLVDERAA